MGMRHAEMPPATAATHATNRDLTTPPDAKGQAHGPGGRGVSFCVPLGVVATSGRSARDRYPQPLKAFHATVRTARKKSGFKAGLRQPTLAEVPLADLSFTQR